MGKKKSESKKENKENFYKKLLNSFTIIKNNKVLFSIAILLGVVYILLSVGIMAFYWVEAATHQQAVFSYIESIPLDDPTTSPLGADPLKVYQEIDAVKKAFLTMGLLILAATFFLDGASWMLVALMRKKESVIEFLKSYTAVFAVYMSLLGVLVYFTFKIAFSDALTGSPSKAMNIIGWVLLLIILYFYFISMGLATNSKLRELPLKTLKNSLKVLITFPAYLLSLFLIIFFGLLTNYFLEGSLFMLMFSIIMLFALIAYSKVLFSSAFE